MSRNDGFRGSPITLALTLAVAFVVLAVLLMLFGVFGLAELDQLCSVGGLICGAVALIITLVRSQTGVARRSQQEIYDEVAKAARDEWGDEYGARRLAGIHSIELTWRVLRRISDGNTRYARGELRQLTRMYRNGGPRRLFILGEPGSGKTSLAVLLFERMVGVRFRGAPPHPGGTWL